MNDLDFKILLNIVRDSSLRDASPPSAHAKIRHFPIGPQHVTNLSFVTLFNLEDFSKVNEILITSALAKPHAYVFLNLLASYISIQREGGKALNDLCLHAR